MRCGRCGEVFNALARLAEDSAAFASGESSLELETRADSILQSDVPLPGAEDIPDETGTFAAPGVEIAQLEVLDWCDEKEPEQPNAGAPDEAEEDPDDRSMEFTLPPGELDRIFIETKVRMPPMPLPPEGDAASRGADSADSADRADRADRADSADGADGVAAGNARAGSGIIGLEVPENVRREMLAGTEPAVLRQRAAQEAGRRIAERRGIERRDTERRVAGRRPFVLWVSAATASALLLIGQMVNHNRSWFGGHGAAPANLSVYQLRQWGVTGDPNANGTLRVRASILNSAGQFQPYPLLRVTLANRFGGRIGTRDFEPAEYLGKPTARLLAPGERVDATLDILDPGKNAEGFEIDVCMRASDQKISCANDVATQAKR